MTKGNTPFLLESKCKRRSRRAEVFEFYVNHCWSKIHPKEKCLLKYSPRWICCVYNKGCLDNNMLGNFLQACIQAFTLKQFIFSIYGGTFFFSSSSTFFLCRHCIVYLLLMVPHKYLPNVSKLLKTLTDSPLVSSLLR